MTSFSARIDQASAGLELAMPTASSSAAWLVDLLLREQADLTAVEKFSAKVESLDGTPANAARYQSLLPATPPGPGQQYAFDVDLDRCSGCKACVAACHSLNGLAEQETWRDVGLLVGGTRSKPVMQHVTTACHHCLEPACMIACPVDAYVKDPITGIVKHLDDQCFGCQYCTLACPYDVPKYLPQLGIVRKCDMCSTRLAVGEAPACAQACPHEAIRIQLVDVQQVTDDAEAALFLPSAPDPQITLPTTTFRTKRVMPRNMLPVGYFELSPQHPHLPLVFMLVLTQLSVGAFVASSVLNQLLSRANWTAFQPVHAGISLSLGLLALAASVLHLGRPHLAWRGILGIKHSWLSREILAFGLFAFLAAVYFGAVMATTFGQIDLANWLTPLAAAVSTVGVAAVFCSVMIYAFTQREYWSLGRTTIRFGLTAALLGLSIAWLNVVLQGSLGSSTFGPEAAREFGRILASCTLLVALAKLTWEAVLFRHLASRHMSSLKRSALLSTRRMPRLTLARFAIGGMGGIVLPIMFLQLCSGTEPYRPHAALFVVSLLASLNIIGELLERYLFFAAVAAPRMPGALK